MLTTLSQWTKMRMIITKRNATRDMSNPKSIFFNGVVVF